MNSLNIRKYKLSSQILFFAIIFFVALCANAWTGPTQAPPGGNTDEPLNTSNQTQTKYGNLYFPKWFDGNNDGYYVDPDANSWLYRLYSYDIRSSIFYDRDNINYYVDPASSSVFNNVYANAFLYNSDKSLKKNINKIENATDKISKLRGVDFKWVKNSEKDIGFIAQEVEEFFPELVKTNLDTGLKSVKYGNITAVLVEALKEQNKKIGELEEKIDELLNK